MLSKYSTTEPFPKHLYLESMYRIKEERRTPLTDKEKKKREKISHKTVVNVTEKQTFTVYIRAHSY